MATKDERGLVIGGVWLSCRPCRWAGVFVQVGGERNVNSRVGSKVVWLGM